MTKKAGGKLYPERQKRREKIVGLGPTL